jgi:hypothetical protein
LLGRLLGVVADGDQAGPDCLDAQVAAGDLPLVVLLGQHRADQSDDRLVVGEDPHDVGATADFAVEPLL